MDYEQRKVPEVVALVALGSSKLAFLTEAMTTGSKRGVADEVWVINKMGVIIEHDLLFRMDDMRQRYQCNDKAFTGGTFSEPTSIHDTYDTFLKNHNKPIITSRAYPEYPTAVEYPLEDVINTIGYSYFRTTPAYAAAFAIHIGVKKLRIYGCDYVYPTDKYRAESGRANLEFILGIGMTMGMEVWVPPTTTLLDSKTPTKERMYGYIDPVEVLPDPEDDKRWKVNFRPDLGEKDRKEAMLKEKGQLQDLMTKYRNDVKRDLIAGKWITKDDIDKHEQKKLLEASEKTAQDESQKGEQSCQVLKDSQKVLPT